MADINVILPGESEYEIKFCRQITNSRVMVDFVQNMHVFETTIFDTFDFGTPSSPKQVINSPKPLYFQKVHSTAMFILFKFFGDLS